ncbi:ABC transporter permease subunit [Facklamia sp. DSM 111018]|uniref:ABC transporter permease subunit n=1 Tax=Facklamia lactis TaxID=2749967 RepID=A0ABS0LNT9_9LACT|nr:ABC transporter permease subunit [Facklamia lactis]MBG9979532.1 ABC transporter permease subunit [Facklamia lactis]MBG9985799.1 ABC transporter permease subunit [Facklamia lactis]
MSSFQVLLKKEWMENYRTHKIISLLLLCIILGIMGPLNALITPDILKNLLPSDAQISIPDPSYIDSYMQFFKGINQIGLIALVIIFSGSLTNELTNQTLINLVTKGLSRRIIILAKFIMIISIWTGSYFISSLVQYGYTLYYFSADGTNKVFTYILTWGFGIFLISLLLLFSSLFKKNTGVLLGVLIVVVILFIISLFNPLKNYNPLFLIQNQSEILLGKVDLEAYFKPLMTTLILIVINLWASIKIFERINL